MKTTHCIVSLQLLILAKLFEGEWSFPFWVGLLVFATVLYLVGGILTCAQTWLRRERTKELKRAAANRVGRMVDNAFATGEGKYNEPPADFKKR